MKVQLDHLPSGKKARLFWACLAGVRAEAKDASEFAKESLSRLGVWAGRRFFADTPDMSIVRQCFAATDVQKIEEPENARSHQHQFEII